MSCQETSVLFTCQLWCVTYPTYNKQTKSQCTPGDQRIIHVPADGGKLGQRGTVSEFHVAELCEQNDRHRYCKVRTTLQSPNLLYLTTDCSEFHIFCAVHVDVFCHVSCRQQGKMAIRCKLVALVSLHSSCLFPAQAKRFCLTFVFT